MSNLFELPILTMKTKLNQTKTWRVWVEDDLIFRQDLFTHTSTVKKPNVRKAEPTNVGRSNQRNGHEQAKYQACRYWLSKISNGYKSPNCSLYDRVIKFKREQGGVETELVQFIMQDKGDEEIDNLIAPLSLKEDTLPEVMLANPYKGKLSEGVWFIQPKLDGIRAISVGNKLFTRSHKEIKFLDHIKNVLSMISSKYPLDGELYCESLCIGNRNIQNPEKFNKISGACRPILKKPASYESQISFYIFDIIIPDVNQQERFEELELIKEKYKVIKTNYPIPDSLKFVPWEQVKTVENVKEIDRKWVQAGYEGTILRKNTTYSKGRTSNLLKNKSFLDSEFKIVGATQGEGSSKGLVVWECQTENNILFTVVPSLDHATREQQYKNREQFIGKLLTIRYQELSDDGVPRFPVGKAIRDYE